MTEYKHSDPPNNTALRIRTLYNTMGKAEKRLADWLLENPDRLIGLSISELAEFAGVSEATVVRFSRKLGFDGYQELKISVAQDISAGYRPIHESVGRTDSCAQIADKVIGDITNALEHTRRILSPERLESAAESIIRARRILICGLGASASVAMDAAHKFIREGLNAVACSDNHMQVIQASQLEKGDVLLAVSHSGSSRDIVECASLAHEQGAVTICITNYGKSPLQAACDIALFTASDETRYRILALSSRIAQLALIDTLYLYVAMRRDEAAVDAVNRAEKALHTKKY